MLIRISIFFGLLTLLAGAVVLSQGLPNPAVSKPGANLSVRNGGAWSLIQRGLEYRAITLERSDPGYWFELKLVRFDTARFVPRILHSADYRLNGADAKTFAQKSHAVAAINASYFDENRRALGFVKIGSRQINSAVSRSSLFTGIFGIRGGVPFILHRDQFHAAHADEALQSGPLLLTQSRALEVSRGSGRASRRAVIGIDNKQRLIVGVTDIALGGATWSELQDLFTADQWKLQTPDLLNLDGGGSAQLYIKTNNFEKFVRGTSEVPVAIGFFERE